MEINPIARIYTGFPEKFGIPRQSGIVKTRGRIVFEEPYGNPDALRALEGYSHLWLIWGFSLNDSNQWSPTVRPPRLGGNKRVGVFATRSPYRPNPLGLSCVEIESIAKEKEGMVIYVVGADMADGTPIYDIKPYLAYTDSHPEAVCGFADDRLSYSVEVRFECGAEILDDEARDNIEKILAHDPRPAYQEDPDRIYRMTLEGFDIAFSAADGVLVVKKIEPYKKRGDKK